MGILIKNNIVNQKGNPAWYESSLATRPIANLQGRMFVDTDTPSTGIYRDNGTTWNQVADPGAGSSGTLQQVTTNGSSTNVGISVSANGIGIGTAIPGANILDIHGTTGVLAQLENTGAQNSLLSFRNQGAGVWSIGNGYNAGANDFIVYDAVSFVNRFTIKSTGQTFIGSDTTSSGLFVVNSATSDNHIVVLGANGPSVRLRNTGTAPTLNVGLGISTATNNFIQGSASGNFCIFNASTTASPILFGIYNSGAAQTQEAARISAARNLLVNSVTDSGENLQVTGTAKITGNLGIGVTLNAWGSNIKAIQVSSGAAFFGQINDVRYASMSANSYYNGTNSIYIGNGEVTLYVQGVGSHAWWNAPSGTAGNTITYNLLMLLANTGNLLLGYNTDNGAKLQVNGNISSGAEIYRDVTSSYLRINGGGSSADGAAILMFGNTHPSAAGRLSLSAVGSESIIFSAGGSIRFTIKNTGVLNTTSMPTSAAGLSSGDIYSNLGILTIVP